MALEFGTYTQNAHLYLKLSQVIAVWGDAQRCRGLKYLFCTAVNNNSEEAFVFTFDIEYIYIYFCVILRIYVLDLFYL